MRPRMETFPFTEVPTDPHPKEVFEALQERARGLVEAFTNRDGAVIGAMLANEELAEDLYAMCLAMAETSATAWRAVGFSPSSKLPQSLMAYTYYWCSILTRVAFVAGVEHVARQDLGQLLDEIDLSGLGGGDDVG